MESSVRTGSSSPRRARLAGLAFTRLAAGIALLAAALLLPAGTLHWWQAWAYLGTVFVPVLLAFAYLLVRDPVLLERRMRTREHMGEQARIVKLSGVCYLLVFVLAGIDHRYQLSHMPDTLVIAADALFLCGYALFIRVLRENRYASRVIEVEPGQPVISTGLYAVVRHPMYSAVLLMNLATPFALGSWPALLLVVPQVALLVARIRHEERVMAAHLQGYAAYLRQTRYRLVPRIW